MNSCSFKRASYCSFASEICPIEESAAVGFLLFFFILLVFCPKEEPTVSALIEWEASRILLCGAKFYFVGLKEIDIWIFSQLF